MEFTLASVLSAIVSILLVSLAIHFGAKPIAKAKHEKFRNAIIVAVAGSLLAGLVQGGLTGVIPGIWPQVVGLAAWALVAGLVYRTSWIKGAIIGLISWLIWIAVGAIMGFILG